MMYQDEILSILRARPAGASSLSIACELEDRLNPREGRDARSRFLIEPRIVFLVLLVLGERGCVRRIDGLWSLSGAEEAGDVHAEQNVAPGAKDHGQSSAGDALNAGQDGVSPEGFDPLLEAWLGRIRSLGPAEEYVFVGAMNEPAATTAPMLPCEAAARLQALARELSEGQRYSAADVLSIAIGSELIAHHGGVSDLLDVLRSR